jgi:hypothetical protein
MAFIEQLFGVDEDCERGLPVDLCDVCELEHRLFSI